MYEIVESGNDIHVKLDDMFSLADTLQSGQTFRWKKFDDGFLGVVGDRVCRVRQDGDTIVFKNCKRADFDEFWCDYFDFNTDYKRIREALKYDKYVSEAFEYCGGIHIMHQPLWETTVSFIISANNNIPRISGIIERLSKRFGEKTECEGVYAFPSAEALSKASVEEIHACGAGYRDEYIKKTAEAFANGSFDASKLYNVPYKQAKKHIMTLCGVGPKVADCILLFSVGVEAAFPIDVWVRKIVCTMYLDTVDYKAVPLGKIEKFAEEHFPKYAGYAQQVLFHYIRNYADTENRDVV